MTNTQQIIKDDFLADLKQLSAKEYEAVRLLVQKMAMKHTALSTNVLAFRLPVRTLDGE